MASHDDLLQQGIAAARAGDNALARQLLAQALKVNPASETAWIWMSGVVESSDQRIHCLQQVLAINPSNALAQKGLQALGVLTDAAPPPPPPPAPVEPESPQPLTYDFGGPSVQTPPPVEPAPLSYPYEEQPSAAPAEPAPLSYDFGTLAPAAPVYEPPPPVSPPLPPPSAAPTAYVPPPPPPAPDGVPMVETAQISAAQQEVEAILRALREEAARPTGGIMWAQPEALAGKRRAPAFVVTPLTFVIIGAVAVVICVVIGVASLVRMVGGLQTASTGATLDPNRPTVTPSMTPAATRTSTPEGTPFEPGPTIEAPGAPRGDLNFGITPTPPYVMTPHPSSPRMNDALEAYYRGDFFGAMDQLQKARDAGYDSADGYLIEGTILISEGSPDQALITFRQGLEKYSDFAPLHAALARLLLQKGQPDQARVEADKAKEIDPLLVDSYVILSDIDTQNGDYRDALAEIEEGKAAVNGYDVNLLVAEGNIYLEQDDFKKAAEVGNLAYYIDPTSEGAVLLISQARLKLKLSPAAIITMENYLLSVNPSSAETWALLAQAYSQSGRANDALQANSRALQLSGNAIDARLTRGLVFLEQGDYEKACEDLNVALEQDPESYEGRNGRAQCAYELGDVKQAIEDLEFVRKITPGRPDVDTLYVKALVADEQWNKAISAASSAFNRGVLSPSQRADVLEAQGYAFYQVGDYNNGFLNLNAAIQIADTGTRHYYLGLIFEALRDYPRALQEYQWVVFWSEIYDYPFTEDAQARAEELGPIVQAGTPTPTPTSSPTPTATATSPATATPPGGTPTQTPRPSNTPGATRTPTPKPSATP